MRITVDLDDDVLEVARSLANHRKQSIGKIISEVFRKHWQTTGEEVFKNRLRVIKRDGSSLPVTLDIVNKLRDES